MLFKKTTDETAPAAQNSTDHQTSVASDTAAATTDEAPKQKAFARRALRNIFNKVLSETLSNICGDVVYFGAYLPVKAVTVSPTTIPTSMIWNAAGKKSPAAKWAMRLAVAVPTALIIPGVLQPLAYRAAFVAATHKTYDCVVNPEDPISTKPYNYSPAQEFAIFPAGYMVGFQNTWLNGRFKIMTPPPADGKLNKYILHAMCANDKGGQEAQTFELTDTWLRSDKKFRSGDMATELASLRGQRVQVGAAGLRYGPESWFKNVLSYKVGGPG